MSRAAFALALAAALAPPCGGAVPASCAQLVVGIADGWDSRSGTLRTFERTRGGWRPASGAVPALFGRNGLAWGIGVAGQGLGSNQKVEGDGRAPAGLFKLGKIYTYSASLPEGAEYPFHTVTPADCWIEDPGNPLYNRHIRVDPEAPPPWFKKEQMRQNDPAHAWKIEIRHNADPPIPGMGSAIFFHIHRGPDRPSSGCTTLSPESMAALVRWLRAPADPHYALLTAGAYLAVWQKWDLPPPDAVGLTSSSARQ